MSIDKKKNAAIAADLAKALAEVAAKHGLQAPKVDLRYSRDGTFCRLMKIDMFTAGVAAPKPVVRRNSKKVGNLFIRMQELGIKNLCNAKGDVLTGYFPSRPAYPFTYTGAKGGKWKASTDQVIARFG